MAALAEMDVEIGNARAAWDYALESGNVEHLHASLDGLCRYYEWRGRYEEGESACDQAAGGLVRTESSDGLRLLSRTLAWQSQFEWLLGRSDLSLELVQRSGQILRTPALAHEDTRSEMAWLLLCMGTIVQHTDVESARRLYEQSLALCRAVGGPWDLANAQAALGSVEQILGAYDEAKRLHEQSLALRRQLGDRRGIASSLFGLRMFATRKAQFVESERLARQSVAILREAGDRLLLAQGLLGLGHLLHAAGKNLQARDSFAESLAVYRDLGARGREAYVGSLLVMALVTHGEYDQATAQLDKGLALAREVGETQGIGTYLAMRCWLILAEGERGGGGLPCDRYSGSVPYAAYLEARSMSQESVAAFREIGYPVELSVALATLALVAHRQGDDPCAWESLREAVRLAAEMGAFYPSIFAVPVVALYLCDRGEVERAIELFALTLRYGLAANSRWHEDVFGRPIAAATASLPPDVVAAAEERGRQRDLNDTVRDLSAELGG